MRLVLAACLVLLSVALAAPARANCKAVCAQHSAGCKQRCAQNAPDDPECPAGCAIAAKTCPELCEVGKRNKGNPERAQREAKAAVNRAMSKQDQHGH